MIFVTEGKPCISCDGCSRFLIIDDEPSAGWQTGEPDDDTDFCPVCVVRRDGVT